MNVARRHLIQIAALAMLPIARAGATAIATPTPASAPRVAFLSPGEAADALAHGDGYYAGMGLQEIRARVGSALPGLSLAEARVAARDFDVGALLPFNDDARAALRGMAERLQPLLLSRAPLYARTGWSFIQLDDRAEGGMPHTRGPHIVLPKAAVDAWTKKHLDAVRARGLAEATFGRSLLLHEQTHVLERLHPDRFEPLITQVFGFTRLPAPPENAWLSTHRCTNPDGPDVVWAFNLTRLGGSGWILPTWYCPTARRRACPRISSRWPSSWCAAPTGTGSSSMPPACPGGVRSTRCLVTPPGSRSRTRTSTPTRSPPWRCRTGSCATCRTWTSGR